MKKMPKLIRKKMPIIRFNKEEYMKDLEHELLLFGEPRVQKKSCLHDFEPEEGFLNLCQF